MSSSMRKAAAATAAGVLLLGGAGTLSYWSDTDTLGGTDVSAGEVSLGVPTCSTWGLDGPVAWDVSHDVVPGDTLTRTCSFVVTVLGQHAAATLEVPQPQWSTTDNDTNLTDELTVSADYTLAGAPAGSSPVALTEADDGKTVGVTISVDFDGPGATDLSNDASLAATLDDITVDLTQTHDPS